MNTIGILTKWGAGKMEMIIGGLITLCGVLLYDKFKPKKKEPTETIDEREKERQKAYEDHWDSVFNYTPEKAYKKVTK